MLCEKQITTIIIGNKIDMLKSKINTPNSHIKISANQKSFVEIIKNKIYNLFISQRIDYQGVIVSNLRHFEALEKASIELNKVKDGLENNISGDFLAMDIRQALLHIGDITGDISSDELLGNIFANFCIGK
tara:strand:- start:20 stop:412 length:393 start_codon:yes stop_codon:yes gene_type:complete